MGYYVSDTAALKHHLKGVNMDGEVSKPVLALAKAIRDQINGPRMSYQLRQDMARWNLLCSSLDALEDTDEAIRAFDPAPIPRQALNERIGQRYLEFYGVLQAMVVQQDATVHLCRALQIEFNLWSAERIRLQNIREMRNATIGHPTEQGRGSNTSNNFLARYSINYPRQIRLMKFQSDGTIEHVDIDIEQLLKDLSEEIQSVLSDVATDLSEQNRRHREQFMNDRFSDAFSGFVGYGIQQLTAATRDPERRDLGEIGVSQVEDLLNDFRARLKEQGMDIDTFESVESIYQDLEYPLSQIRAYFSNQDSDIRNDRLGEIVAHYIASRVTELKSIAKELDSDNDDALD